MLFSGKVFVRGVGFSDRGVWLGEVFGFGPEVLCCFSFLVLVLGTEGLLC